MPVRCSYCNRVGLPVVPGSKGGNGTLAHPVAHVRSTYLVDRPIAPCFEGETRESLILADTPELARIKTMIWTDDALWDL